MSERDRAFFEYVRSDQELREVLEILSGKVLTLDELLNLSRRDSEVVGLTIHDLSDMELIESVQLPGDLNCRPFRLTVRGREFVKEFATK